MDIYDVYSIAAAPKHTLIKRGVSMFGRDVRFKSACVFLTLLSVVVFSQQRYKDYCFESAAVESGIVYRTAENRGGIDTLAFDLYTPEGDQQNLRPLVIFMHGGSFVSGSRDEDYVVEFCTEMARRGYVAAALSYRLGTLNDDFTLMAYRAVQDSRAAVRFFRANGETYGIDTSAIICGGYSAGALTALQHVCLNDNTISQIVDTDVHGPLDTGEYTEFSSSVSTVINYCGAVVDTLLLEGITTPVVSIHGTDDNTVPYGAGYAFGVSIFPMLYGSGIIHPILNSMNVENLLITAEGEAHTLLPETFAASIPQAANFIYSLLDEPSIVTSGTADRTRMRAAMRTDKGVFLHNRTLTNKTFDLRGRAISGGLRPGASAAGVYLMKTPREDNRRF